MDIDSDFVDNIKACRTCGIHYVTPSQHQLKHLFQSCQEHSEIKLIRLELSQWNVEVAENDGFPQYVCNTCIHKFEQVFELRTACVNAQNEFRKFYAVPNGNIANLKIKTELPESEGVPSVCDFIYVDELSDTEYDGATPFNFPHIPIKEELIEAATIPMEESQTPTNFVESASRVVVQIDPSTSYEPKEASQHESVAASQPAAVSQIDVNEFQCDLCLYVSSNGEEHKQHMHSTHAIGDFECDVCGKEFKNSTQARLRFHMKWHTLNKQVKCTICGFVCNSKEVLRDHKKENHRKLNCKVCGEGVLAKKMKSHLRLHKLNSKYSCEYCTEAFSTETERENHIWEIHANEDNTTNSTQNINAKSFNVEQEERLLQESQEHFLFKFICAHCEHRFMHQVDLETHVNEEHRANLTTVDHQTISFVEDAPITETSEVAQNEQANIAVFEDYDNDNEIHVPANDSSINNSTDLKQDFRVPLSSPNFVTQNKNTQSAISGSNSSLNEESNGEETESETLSNVSYVDSNLNTFACAKCSETFIAIEQLRQHHEQHLADQIKTSPSKLKFQCHFCAKSFSLKFSLNRHIKKHKNAPF